MEHAHTHAHTHTHTPHAESNTQTNSLKHIQTLYNNIIISSAATL